MPTFHIAKNEGVADRNPSNGEPEAGRPGRGSLSLRQLWVTLASRKWTSLAVVPMAGLTSLPFAEALVEAAGHCGARAATVDASQCDLRGVARVLQELAVSRPEGVRVVAAVDSVLLGLAAVQVALAADGVLLLVPYGHTDLDSVRAAIDAVGRDRILGCVTFRDR